MNRIGQENEWDKSKDERGQTSNQMSQMTNRCPNCDGLCMSCHSSAKTKLKTFFLLLLFFACTPSVEYQMPLNDYYPSFHSYLPLNIINWNADTLLNERCELKTITSERNWLEPLNAINEDTVDFFFLSLHQTKWKVKLCGK